MVPHANQPPSTVDIAHTHALDARTRALDDALARERPAGMNSLLKVCTWNAQMLPGVFAGQGGTRTDIAKRAHAMANNILCCSRADAIDVVCLQEMWEVEAAKALKVALREEFPFVYAPSALAFGGQSARATRRARRASARASSMRASAREMSTREMSSSEASDARTRAGGSSGRTSTARRRSARDARAAASLRWMDAS